MVVLLNPTVVPGVAVVCVALLMTSGVSFRRRCSLGGHCRCLPQLRCPRGGLCRSSLVRDRLVRWDIPLRGDLEARRGVADRGAGGLTRSAAAWAARSGSRPCRSGSRSPSGGRLVGRPWSGDLFGYLRPERWLMVPILVAAIAVAGLTRITWRRWFSSDGASDGIHHQRSVSRLAFVAATGHWEIVPLAMWLVLVAAP